MQSIIPVKDNFLSRLLRRVGNNSFEKQYLSHFFKDIDYPDPVKGKILIYSGIGHMYLTPLEILIYHLLRKEGYNVDYYIYNRNIPINEIITGDVIKKTSKDDYWNRSVNNAENLLKAAKVKYCFISLPPEIDTLIEPIKDDLTKILTFTYDGIDFGETVKSVMYRFYKSISFGEDALLRATEFLRTSLANYFQIKKLASENNYKYVFFSHGIYCTWQPVLEYCKRNQISFICYDRGKRSGTANFNINQASPDWSFDDAWIKYSKRSLTNEEEKKVDEYFNERELQKSDVYTFNSSKRAEDIEVVKKSLNINLNAKVVTIFTNLIWDAANVSRDIAFSSALDCMEQTIKYFAGNKRVHILIRSHPAEKVIGSSERYGSLIREKFNGQLPSNVTVVEPEMEINSFTVIDISDIGVVNTSTIGLEFAMLGKPIILISETHYRDRGFTYDAISAKDYFDKIDYLLTHITSLPEQVNLARKYFYMMMFLYQKPIPLKFHNNLFEGYTVKNIEHLTCKDPLLKVIKSLEKDNIKDFIFWE